MELHPQEDKSLFPSNQKMEKVDILGDLSHEIRALLNTILGFTSLMKDPDLSEADRQRFIDRVMVNGDQLLQILDDALNFSKIEKGEVILERVSFNIIEMIYDVIKSLKSTADKKALEIHLRFETPIPQTVTTDPIKVRQILTHLLGNAIRFTNGNGFILISLYCESDQDEKNLFIKVDDSGAGIEELPKFEAAFSQTLTSVRPGFALSQKFAEAVSGSLMAKASDLGEGQCVTFSFPCGDLTGVTFLNQRKSASSLEKVLTHFQSQKEGRLRNIKVLLVEDSADSETVIRLFLTKEGALLTYAHNGLEAIEAVKVGVFDVILMDIQMPLLDGLEATRQIRQLGFQMPIIALTAYALRDDAEKSLKAGCDSHLSKPIQRELLIEEIQRRVLH